MRTKSTELMEDIKRCIENCYFSTGKTPSVREIAEQLGISKSSVSNYLIEMRDRGLLENSGGWRGAKTKRMGKIQQDVAYLPVVGQIACGTPFLAEENIETYLPLPKDMLGMGEYFVLVAKGESMVNARIDDGDYVIVRRQETAEPGQIVVALIGDEATLKRYYPDEENRQIRLHPENDEMEDMSFKNISVQGIAVKVIKDVS